MHTRKQINISVQFFSIKQDVGTIVNIIIAMHFYRYEDKKSMCAIMFVFVCCNKNNSKGRIQLRAQF